jgi:hypothetical protein
MSAWSPNASLSLCPRYVRSTLAADISGPVRHFAFVPNADIRHVRADAEICPTVWPPNGHRSPAPSVAARGGVILLRGGIDVPRERTSAVVPREKFQELPVLGIPGMSESAFDGGALEGAANGSTTAARSWPAPSPGRPTSGMPPSSTTFPRPTSYPGSPPPVIFPNTRPVIMPGFCLHRHRH